MDSFITVKKQRSSHESDYPGNWSTITEDELPVLNIGDTVKVFVKIKEGGKVRIAFEFKDGNAGIQLRPASDGGYDYKYVVMPLRIW